MLTQVRIKHFRNCRDVVLDDLQKVIALIGRNAVGKSTILQAVEWLAVSASSHMSAAYAEVDESSIEADITLPNGNYCYSLSFSKDRDYQSDSPNETTTVVESLRFSDKVTDVWQDVFVRNDEAVEIFGEESKSLTLGPASTMPGIQSLLPGSVTVQIITPLVEFFSRVRYCPFDEPTKSPTSYVIFEQQYQRWQADYAKTRNPGTDVPTKIVHLFRTQDERLSELKAILGPNGLGVIDEIRVGASPNKNDEKGSPRSFNWVAFIARSGEPHGFGELSLGTRRVCQIVLSLLMDDASVILLEHPEDGIHRGLLIKVLSHMKRSSGPTQLFLSSHSPVVMNTLEPSQLRLVDLDAAGHSYVRKLTDIEITSAQSYLEREGSLSDFIDSIE